jgi:protein tyrosine/serine phosphatase
VKPGVLYRSGQPTSPELDHLLRQYGVRTVVSLRADTPEEDERIPAEVAAVGRYGANYRQIAMSTPPTAEQMRECLSAIRSSDLARPILVHCKAGRTRTGAVVALWRVLEEGWSRDDAIAEARDYGLHDRDTMRFIREYAPARLSRSR